uniref:Cytochrome c553 n=1 Tax=Candidatus Kentrum sp. TUN TaxID=2126343 RepID=A0A450ZQH0_9GAMM|nr:MAG: Cytochrome c553 [Candidatus Kentron sp. TUN]VFK53971.1 MAG: Cytochrome c553 [Candidatus Kentron sp. TUN]VFK56063.1 MAG: Cytochrome c553 [Candidatus Kentron sp. TUN]
MKNLLLTSLLVLSVTTSVSATEPVAATSGDVEAGKAKSAVCAGCHGADGNSLAPQFPKLAGQHASYLLKQIKDFRAATHRSSAIMQPFATGKSIEDMQDIVAYFAAQKKSPGYAKGKPENLALGKKIYRAGNPKTKVAACMSCHGPAGIGNSLAKFPALAGQHADYTKSQLNAFRSKSRKNDFKSMMRMTAEQLTDREIEAVSQYIAGLH